MKRIQTEEKNKKEIKKNISKEIDKKISGKVFINLIIAVIIMVYFCVMSIVSKNVSQTQMVDIVKIVTLGFLFITIVLIEIAYKKESSRMLIHASEALIMSVHSLTTMYVIKIYDFDFQNYILTSSYIFSIYYVLKAIIINTKARRDYLKGLSDIAQIVKKEEPSKKQAFKREKIFEEEKTKEKQINSKKEEKKEKKQINSKEIEKINKKQNKNSKNSKNKKTIKNKKESKTEKEEVK